MVEWVGSWIRDRGLAEADAGKVENMGGKYCGQASLAAVAAPICS